MKNENVGKIVSSIAILLIFIYIIASIIGMDSRNNPSMYKNSKTEGTTLNILVSSENQDLQSVIENYIKGKDYNVNIEYAGTLEIMEKLNRGEEYDAVWISNSIWLYMLNDSVNISNSKCTSINPVIFGITKSKAEELGFVGKDIYTQDIVNSISNGNLKFSMSNPTTTNSGASAYLGLLSTLAGNPEVLKEDNLNDEKLKEKVTTLFSGLERSSGSEEFLEELFLAGEYEAVVTYESSIISLNKQLESQGKETLYAIYPIDGVSISDAPFAYIDNGNENKKAAFTDLQSYILSDQGQKVLQEKGRRTWYGGVSSTVDKTIFRTDWGINTEKYISPIKYPSTNVIKSALALYQSELRKPVHVVFCLDYSGSMIGTGYDELISAMEYILSEAAEAEYLQFSSKDKIDIIPFSTGVIDTWSTINGADTNNLLESIKTLEPNGSTAIYPAVEEAVKILADEDRDTYNTSVILMTDGQGNVGRQEDLEKTYTDIGKEIPIYSIMFGYASEIQLSEIAEMSNGKVFDGKTDLIKAFKEVRGYN